MEQDPDEGNGAQQSDVVALILRHLAEPKDVLAAAAVCRTWRAAATDISQLRSWQYDDDLSTSAGIKSSAAPLQPRTPLPKHWVNPTTHSPFSSFKTPKSLAMLAAPSPIRSLLWPSDRLTDSHAGVSNAEDSGPSPRTPSPVQTIAPGESLLDTVVAQMAIGKFIGDIDISSSRLNDKSLQTIFKSCPRLHTLRLQHLCVPSMYPSNSLDLGPSPLRVGDVGPDKYVLPPVLSCGCGQLSEKGFAAVRWHCSDLSSVTLVLQHVISKRVHRQLLTELGALPKLHTLSVELRMPSFGQSVKSQLIWQEHTHCTDKELLALLNAGPPPLSALALNRCDLTESSIASLAAACPNLEAIDLRSSSDIQGEHDIPPSIGALFQNLTSLSAAALGVFQASERLSFDTWIMPSLKRLRLETMEPLSLNHLQSLKYACSKLESLHLISGTHATENIFGCKSTAKACNFLSLCVLDTDALKSLKQLEGIRETRIIVLQIVLRELDSLKRRHDIGHSARMVLNWIEDYMERIPFWMHAQTSTETSPIRRTTVLHHLRPHDSGEFLYTATRDKCHSPMTITYWIVPCCLFLA